MELNYFLDFAHRCYKSSYSQNLQDLWGIWENLAEDNFYFVEFGALAGINVSNSYLMELLGWNGIVAEPHPAYKEPLKNNRKCDICFDAVFSTTGERIKFKIYKGMPARSTISAFEREEEEFKNKENFKEVVVETISLTDMLLKYKAPSQIGFISIDTEGSELAILKTFDFSQHKFNSLCVEFGTEENRAEIFQVLSSNGYKRKFEEISGHDDWYVHEDRSMDVEKNYALAKDLMDKVDSMENDMMERAKNRNSRKLSKLTEQYPV